MKPEAVSRHCAALLGSTEDYPFGDQPVVYKVGGKMFVLLSEDADAPSVTLKLPPEEGEALRAQYPGTVQPGYHLNKRHWNTILLDGQLDEGELLDLLTQSYDTVVAALPRRLRPS